MGDAKAAFASPDDCKLTTLGDVKVAVFAREYEGMAAWLARETGVDMVAWFASRVGPALARYWAVIV